MICSAFTVTMPPGRPKAIGVRMSDSHFAGCPSPHGLVKEPLLLLNGPAAAPVRLPALALGVCGDLAEIEHAWRDLELTARRTVFQSFDWLAKYQRHVGAPRGICPAIVTGRAADGRLALILPLAIERRGFLRRLSWLG